MKKCIIKNLNSADKHCYVVHVVDITNREDKYYSLWQNFGWGLVWGDKKHAKLFKSYKEAQKVIQVYGMGIRNKYLLEDVD